MHSHRLQHHHSVLNFHLIADPKPSSSSPAFLAWGKARSHARSRRHRSHRGGRAASGCGLVRTTRAPAGVRRSKAMCARRWPWAPTSSSTVSTSTLSECLPPQQLPFFSQRSSHGWNSSDIRQRAHFVQLGMESRPRPRIHCLVLTASDKTLRERLEGRTDHPTLRDAAQAIGVLGRMRREWEAPRASEGFDRILTLRENDTPSVWGGNEILNVLQRLDRSMPPRPYGAYRGAHGFGHPPRGRGAPVHGSHSYRGRGYAPRGGMRGTALGPPTYGARPWVPQPARDAAPAPW